MKSVNNVSIDQGNTVFGVTAFVIDQILTLYPNISKLNDVFDIPCGEGYFLKALKKLIPFTNLSGIDAYAQPLADVKDLIKKQSSDDWSPEASSLDVITCISGIMCFDNIDNLFKKSSQALRSKGYLIVTNDNVLSIRDRLSWFFFGHPKRFNPIYSNNEGNWNIVLPQALHRLFEINNFNEIRIVYLSFRLEDLVFVPFVFILYPIELLYLCFYKKNSFNFRTKIMIYQLKSMICRHYVVIGRKK